MHWIRDLDEALIAPLSEAATRAVGYHCRCEPDLINGGFRVVIPGRISPDSKRAIRQAVFKRASELRPILADCEVYVETPKVTTYTSHLTASPGNVRPFETHSHVTTFDLPLSDLIAFRDAESEIAKRCAKAARVATFALGGVSTLSRLSFDEWDEISLQPVVDGPIASDLIREKYHLLPGLNWRSQVDSKSVFIDWLSSIDTAGKVLIFDTGTEGNAPRQIFRLIRERLSTCDTKGNLDIEIVGIVDGDNPKSVPVEREGRSRNGNMYIMTVEYLTVPRVLSEDFQSLMGYRKLDKLGYLEPLRDIGIVRLVHEGRVVQISATDNLANVFRGYMTNGIGGYERLARADREVLTPEVELALLEEALGYARSGEMQQLHNAWAIGLISDRDALAIQKEMEARYNQEFQEYPRHVWSFAEKTILIKTGKLYDILRDVARSHGTITHSELSNHYHRIAGDYPHPRKTWELPLRIIDDLARDAGLPYLSAVVICGGGENWPGTDPALPADSFWSVAGVRERPENRREREIAWQSLLDEVQRADWPELLKGTD